MPEATPEGDMKLTYEIFRKFAEDGPIWIETVQGIEKCKSRLLDLVQRNPGEYFAFDPLHSRVVAESSKPKPFRFRTTRGFGCLSRIYRRAALKIRPAELLHPK